MPNATTVQLEPLSEEESARLVDNLVGEAGLDETVRRRIVEAAEGNPLFVEEMLALATEDGGRDGGLEIPPTIQALLAARLDRLGVDERAVVEHAAVEGKVFYENAVCEEAPEVLRPRVAAALGSLLRKELIRPDRPGLGGRTYRFRHLLIRDAAYDSIPKQARARLHEDFAGWLERAARDRAAEYEEVVGYHFEQAYRYRTELEPIDDAARELGKRAAERLGAAGRRALVRSDAPAGVNLISRAVATLRPDDPLRVELIPNVRSIQGMSGDLSWADRALTEAVEAAATSGDRRLAAHALVQRGLLRLFTESDVTSEELLDAAGRAIVVFEEFGDELGLARAWRLVAQAHYLAQRAAASAAAAEEALARIRRVGDPFEEREIVEWLLVVQQLGPMPIAAAIDRTRILLADAGSDRLLRVIVLSTLAVFEASLGHAEDAAKLVAEARRALDEHGDLIPVCFWCRAWVRILSDDLEEAEADLRAGYEALRTLGRTGHFSSQCVLLAHVSYRLGRHDNAERYAEEAQAASRANDVHTWTSVRAIRASVLAWRGDVEHAERLARDAVDYAAEGDFLPVHADALMGLARVLRLAGRSAEAAAPLEEAVGLLERKGDIVSAARTRALLAELGTSSAPEE
jgi:tetratricopeptide (TPR) repeat protein